LTVADAAAMRDEVPGVARLSTVVNGNAQVIAGNQNWQTRVQGVQPEYRQIQNWQVAFGSFFEADDDLCARTVAVLGQTVARTLFTNVQAAVGQTVRVRNVPFVVIGVLAGKGATGF